MSLRRHFKSVGMSDFGLVSTILAIVLAMSVLVLPLAERLFLERTGAEGRATLRLAVASLQATIDRFEPLPALVAERPLVSAVLEDRQNETLSNALNVQLEETAEQLGASDIYVMDRDGLTIASSNHALERSFLGRSFTFRPYFSEALEGQLGRFFALGTTSGQRGYYLGTPVRREGQIIGVVALKFILDGFEAAWRRSQSDILIIDQAGVVFMATRPGWQFRTLGELATQDRAQIVRTRQYPLDRLLPLNQVREEIATDYALVRIDDGGFGAYYVTSSITMPDIGWRAVILTPAGPRALSALMLFVMTAVVLGLVITQLIQRRARLRADQEAQRQLQDLLERRVEERTADLNAANAHLRKTQKELIQAGKLAALGQMSAALSHEINQPLAAVKSYAENAATFLDRDRPADARENVSRISKMADRMAAITGHLRNFARRPQDDVGPIEVGRAVDDALALMEPRIKSLAAAVSYAPPAKPVWVYGGQLRLQQVIINLLNNALDSMEGQAERTLEVAVDAVSSDTICIHVRDVGPGLDEDALAQVFDPFFTTKSPGKGLGLGLSISFNIVEDFGGRLRARNLTQEDATMGAEFSIELRRAQAPVAAGVQEVAAE
ncbi:MAG: ATP-binding protein [Devosiaceae bacterium]